MKRTLKPLLLGEFVCKSSVDYTLNGQIVAKFQNWDGQERYVVEHLAAKGCFYHIYSRAQLTVISMKALEYEHPKRSGPKTVASSRTTKPRAGPKSRTK